ncbi:TetR family transcriptional regulator [Amycolatopsis sp. NBRC 101858]|uniref:TetR/AcrR family transcriptional regulator n=1 Tax=Amycolatopsis sp. NBRC 101858 TaxID=3032200 RepID=UPI0024A19938|nr:TetR family transcriptional regulator [Amycolatopsis sp. NBRC 101858]GLY38945.1 TetR family transcriptional regulator [Amycolatopsis sp. NBRC 101858]
MPSKTERKTERYYRKREHVVDVAVRLFSRNGYVGTGVADIGEAAGLARGALYYYIGSKEALLAEIHDRVLDPLLAEGAAIVASEASFPVRLRLLSESLLWQIMNRQDHVWVFLHEYQQLQGELRIRFRQKRYRFESFVRDTISAGRDDGALRIQDVDLATLAFLNLHNYTYQWVGGRRGLAVESLSAFYCEIFLNGILGEPGDASADTGAALDRGRALLRTVRGSAA